MLTTRRFQPSWIYESGDESPRHSLIIMCREPRGFRDWKKRPRVDFFFPQLWVVSRRQTTIQVNFIDLYGSRVYVVCFISRPPNRVRKLLCNLRTLKRLVASIYLQFLHCRCDIQWFWTSFLIKLNLIYFLNALNLWIWPQEPAGRTLLAWKPYIPLWRRLYQHGRTVCTRYSSNSFLRSLMVKTYYAALQLATENQQPSLFLDLFSSNTMHIRMHTLLIAYLKKTYWCRNHTDKGISQ